MSKKRTHGEFAVGHDDIITPDAKRQKTLSIYETAIAYIDDYRNGVISEQEMVQKIFKLPSKPEDFKQPDKKNSVLYHAIDVDSPMLVRVLITLKGVSSREEYTIDDDRTFYAFQLMPVEPKKYKDILKVLHAKDPAIHINVIGPSGDTTATHTAQYGSLEAWKYLLGEFKGVELRRKSPNTRKNAFIELMTSTEVERIERLREIANSPEYRKLFLVKSRENHTLFHHMAVHVDEILPEELPVMIELLMGEGVDLMQRDNKGRLPSEYVNQAVGCNPYRKLLAGLETDMDNCGEIIDVFFAETAAQEQQILAEVNHAAAAAATAPAQGPHATKILNEQGSGKAPGK